MTVRITTVRDNLMNRPGYRPYCGNYECPEMPRTIWTGEQFHCTSCGWKSSYEPEFIEAYKAKWQQVEQDKQP